MGISLRAMAYAEGALVGAVSGVLLHPTGPLALALLVKDLRLLGAERLVAPRQIAAAANERVTLSLSAASFDELGAFDGPHGSWGDQVIAALLAGGPPTPDAVSRLRQRVIRWRSSVRSPSQALGWLAGCAIAPEDGRISALLVRPRWSALQPARRYGVAALDVRDGQTLVVYPGTAGDPG